MSLLTLPKLVGRHVPSGRTYDCKWTGHQHGMLSDPEFYAARTIQKVCDDLVARWNREQPAIWHYTLQ